MVQCYLNDGSVLLSEDFKGFPEKDRISMGDRHRTFSYESSVSVSVSGIAKSEIVSALACFALHF